MEKQKIILWVTVSLLILASVFGLLFFFWWLDNKSGEIVKELKPITAVDWTRGGGSAKVVIIEYSDFECPACAAYHPLLKRVKEKFGDQINIVYRYFPLTEIHLNAELAAMAAEASGRQGKFWEMHDLLFENQKNWSKKSGAKEIFINYAKELQLDISRFENDLSAKEIKDRVFLDYNEGVSLGIIGTPTIFLNGEKMPVIRTAQEFEKIIFEKLNQ